MDSEGPGGGAPGAVFSKYNTMERRVEQADAMLSTIAQPAPAESMPGCQQLAVLSPEMRDISKKAEEIFMGNNTSKLQVPACKVQELTKRKVSKPKREDNQAHADAGTDDDSSGMTTPTSRASGSAGAALSQW